MASELFLVNPRGRRTRRRVRRGRRNPAGELLVLTGNPRGRRTKRRRHSSSTKAARALRLAKRLRRRGMSAGRALKSAWKKILKKRKRTRKARTHSRSRSRIHSRRKSASSRRTHMARRKRPRRRSHRRHVRRPARRMRLRSNPVRRHRSRRKHTRRVHSRRRSRSLGGFLRNPMSLGSFFILPSVKTALWVGGGAVATWFVANRFVSPFIGRFMPVAMARFTPIVGNLATAGLLAGLTGMAFGREAAMNVALGGAVYTVLEVATPILSGLMAPSAAPAQVETAPAAGYYMGNDVHPQTAAAMNYYMGR